MKRKEKNEYAIVLAELTYLFTAMLSKPVPTLIAIAVNI